MAQEVTTNDAGMEPPFNPSITAQLAALQRKDIESTVNAVAKDVAAIVQTLARQDERLLAASATISKIEKNLEEVKETVSKYKGGIAVILGASTFLVGVVALWDKIVAKFHQ